MPHSILPCQLTEASNLVPPLIAIEGATANFSVWFTVGISLVSAYVLWLLIEEWDDWSKFPEAIVKNLNAIVVMAFESYGVIACWYCAKYAYLSGLKHELKIDWPIGRQLPIKTPDGAVELVPQVSASVIVPASYNHEISVFVIIGCFVVAAVLVNEILKMFVAHEVARNRVQRWVRRVAPPTSTDTGSSTPSTTKDAPPEH